MDVRGFRKRSISEHQMTPVTTDKDDEKTPEEPNDWWHFLLDSKIREGVIFEGRLARGGADSKLVSSSPRS